MKRNLTALFAALLLLAALAVPGYAVQAEEGNLALAVTEITEQGNGKTITVTYDNQTGHEIACGWVSSCNLEVTTTDGIYSFPVNEFSYRFDRGSGTMTFQVSPCPGAVESVAFTDLRLLDDRGLPERELGKIEISLGDAPTAETASPSEEPAHESITPSQTSAPVEIAPSQAPSTTVVIPDQTTSPYDKFMVRFNRGKSMMKVWGVLLCILMLLSLTFNIIKAKLKGSQVGIEEAGAAGERDVEFRLRQWLNGHPEFRLIQRDCQSKYSDECILLRDARGAVHEIDHILVGPPGILQIETKNYSGIIQILDDVTWLRQKRNSSAYPEESPVDQVNRHEAALQSIVGDGVNLGSIICIAHKESAVLDKEKSSIPVVEIRYLTAILDQLAARPGDTDVKAVCRAIEEAKVHEPVPQKAGNSLNSVRRLQRAARILSILIIVGFVSAILLFIFMILLT